MYRNILCPIDGSPTSSAGMREAITLAKALKSRVRFIYVLDMLIYATAPGLDMTEQIRASGQAILDKAIEKAAIAGVDASSQILETSGMSVSDAILDEAKNWKAQTIVMGTHGRHGVTHLVMGSDAENVVKSSTVPVLVVRQA
ncbi:MAG TPA: universal stress protein [Methylophilaceae bacterium]|jgi:nucleotide-binding universal stress UspA family protein